jgi:NAD(P)-dependent dehydrogenase (short-subunit alcohol dehydrogenase family)
LKEIAKKDSLPLEVLKQDVTDDKSVTDAIDVISSRHGRVDVLVNNAGYDAFGAVEDLSMKEIRMQFETNFFGAVRLIKAVIPIMRKQRSGIIVNVSSIGGLVGVVAVEVAAVVVLVLAPGRTATITKPLYHKIWSVLRGYQLYSHLDSVTYVKSPI